MTEPLIAAGLVLAPVGPLASWLSYSWHTQLRNEATMLLDRHPAATRFRLTSGAATVAAGALLVVLGLVGADMWTAAPVMAAAVLVMLVAGRRALRFRAR